MKKESSFPIDAVVLWVDGTDKSWAEKKINTAVMVI